MNAIYKLVNNQLLFRLILMILLLELKKCQFVLHLINSNYKNKLVLLMSPLNLTNIWILFLFSDFMML